MSHADHFQTAECRPGADLSQRGVRERQGELVLKNSVRRRVVPSGEFLLVRVFLAVVCLLRGGHRWLRFQVEEPHQSFQVLGHGSQVELLTHELDSA